MEISEPNIVDTFPNNDELPWYGIYYRHETVTEEWHVKANSVMEAIGIFFTKNIFATYDEIIDHMEL